jgi:hypothetical protein
MRKVIVGFSLALIALALSPAEARYRHHHYYNYSNYSEVRPHYESCNCYFGYMGNSAGECTPVTSCDSEGGRCRAGCPPQIGSEWFRSSQGTGAAQ